MRASTALASRRFFFVSFECLTRVPACAHVCHWQTADDGDEPGGHRNFISATMQTGLCDWSAKYFAQPVMKVEPLPPSQHASL